MMMSVSSAYWRTRQGVLQHVIQFDEPLEDVGGDQEEVGRERIALTQPT
jgi:hypothetical protein